MQLTQGMVMPGRRVFGCRKSNRDALTVRVEHVEHATTDTADAARRHLAELVKRTIWVTIGVEVTEPGGIERSVGKMKRIVDLRPGTGKESAALSGAGAAMSDSAAPEPAEGTLAEAFGQLGGVGWLERTRIGP